MIKYLLLSASFSIVLLMSGCASKATMENMVYNQGVGIYTPQLKQSVSLEKVSGGKETNPLWTSQIGNEEFKEAVRKSLQHESLYAENGRYKLSVEIVDLAQPLFGLDLNVILQVNYILTETITNKELLKKTISTPYTATFNDSAIAIIRLRLANEGAGRENINSLLQELKKLKIDTDDISLKN